MSAKAHAHLQRRCREPPTSLIAHRHIPPTSLNARRPTAEISTWTPSHSTRHPPSPPAPHYLLLTTDHPLLTTHHPAPTPRLCTGLYRHVVRCIIEQWQQAVIHLREEATEQRHQLEHQRIVQLREAADARATNALANLVKQALASTAGTRREDGQTHPIMPNRTQPHPYST